MNSLRNSVRLTGFLGNTPEIKIVGSSKKLARVSLAINTSYKNEKGDKIDETQWHQLVLWDKNAELAEKQFQKGSEISIEGKLSSRNYTDKSGAKKYITEVVVNEVLLLAKK